MANPGFTITNSFLDEFDSRFHPFLRQEGSKLINYVDPVSVNGATHSIRQSTVGKAHIITSAGSITDYTNIEHDRRELRPIPFACPIMLDDIDLVQQGTPDVAMLAQQASYSCGEIIDEFIIKGLGGMSRSLALGDISFPDSQTIRWNENKFAENSTNTLNGQINMNGLSASKVAQAIVMLQEEYNSGTFVCVASPYALQTFRSDSRVSNMDFNMQPAFATGHATPFAGVHHFVASSKVDTGTSTVSASDGTTAVEYAYIYNLNQVKLGISQPLALKYGRNPERYLNNTLIYWGMYHCTRMFEESVVRIEVKRDNTTPAS